MGFTDVFKTYSNKPSMPDFVNLVYGDSSRNRGPPFGNPAHAIP